MAEMKGKYIVQAISFPDPELLELAKATAKAQRRSLSNYVCGLLEKDLKAAPELALNEPAGRYQPAGNPGGERSSPAPAPLQSYSAKPKVAPETSALNQIIKRGAEAAWPNKFNSDEAGRANNPSPSAVEVIEAAAAGKPAAAIAAPPGSTRPPKPATRRRSSPPKPVSKHAT